MSKSYDELWRMLNVADLTGEGLMPWQVRLAMQLLGSESPEEAYDRGAEDGYNEGLHELP